MRRTHLSLASAKSIDQVSLRRLNQNFSLLLFFCMSSVPKSGFYGSIGVCRFAKYHGDAVSPFFTEHDSFEQFFFFFFFIKNIVLHIEDVLHLALCLSLCLCVCVCVSLSLSLSVCLRLSLCLSLFVCLSVSVPSDYLFLIQ